VLNIKKYNSIKLGLSEKELIDNFTDEKIQKEKLVLYLEIPYEQDTVYFATKLENINNLISFLTKNSIENIQENSEDKPNWIYEVDKDEEYNIRCPACNKEPYYKGCSIIREIEKQGDKHAKYTPSYCLECYEQLEKDLKKIKKDTKKENIKKLITSTILTKK
jgi:uncharacterized protein with PIN domain